MRRIMTSLGLVMLVSVVQAEPEKEKTAKPAKVVVTAELACMHCTFGEGDSCAVALKLDDKTPLLLEGKAAEELFPQRLKKKIVVVEGTLKLKEKQMVLVADKARPFDAKEKSDAPPQGTAFIQGDAMCGRCDLGLCEECTLAVKNAGNHIILDGGLAADHAEGKSTLSVSGKLFVDKRGLLRINASKVDAKKKD